MAEALQNTTQIGRLRDLVGFDISDEQFASPKSRLPAVNFVTHDMTAPCPQGSQCVRGGKQQISCLRTEGLGLAQGYGKYC